MSHMERGAIAELKKRNYSKIVAGGLPFVRNPQFGSDSANVGQLTLSNGSIIRDSSLAFDLGQDLGIIALNGEDRPISEFKYYAEPAEGGGLAFESSYKHL